MRNYSMTSAFALMLHSAGEQAKPMTETEIENADQVGAFQKSQRSPEEQAKRDELGIKTPEQIASDRKAVEEHQSRMAIGGNRPPIETTYVPEAKNPEQLKAEANEFVAALLDHDARGETTIMARFTRVASDMLYMGMPELGTNREDVAFLGVRFVKDQAEPNLYDQLRSEMQRTVKGDTTKGIYFTDASVMETSTFKQYLGPVCRKACLIAFGYAEIGYIPANLRGPALYQAKGVLPQDMPKDFDVSQWVQMVMVRDNVLRPVAVEVLSFRDGKEQVKPGSERPNDDRTLTYLSSKVADTLYAQHFDGVGEASLERDIHGYLLGIKAKRATGGTQDQSSTTTTTNGTTTPQAGPTNGDAKPGDNVIPSYQRLKSHFEKLPGLAGGESDVMGALLGIWEVINKESTAIDKDVLRVLGYIARAAISRIRSDYSIEGAPIPEARMVKPWADTFTELAGHLQYEDKDGNVVMFRPLDGKKAIIHRIKVKDADEVVDAPKEEVKA